MENEKNLLVILVNVVKTFIEVVNNLSGQVAMIHFGDQFCAYSNSVEPRMLTGVFGGMTLPSAVEYRSLEGNLHRSRTSPVALSSSDFISWMLDVEDCGGEDIPLF